MRFPLIIAALLLAAVVIMTVIPINEYTSSHPLLSVIPYFIYMIVIFAFCSFTFFLIPRYLQIMPEVENLYMPMIVCLIIGIGTYILAVIIKPLIGNMVFRYVLLGSGIIFCIGIIIYMASLTRLVNTAQCKWGFGIIPFILQGCAWTLVGVIWLVYHSFTGEPYAEALPSRSIITLACFNTALLTWLVWS